MTKTTIVYTIEERTKREREDKDVQIETENTKLCARREQSLIEGFVYYHIYEPS